MLAQWCNFFYLFLMKQSDKLLNYFQLDPVKKKNCEKGYITYYNTKSHICNLPNLMININSVDDFNKRTNSFIEPTVQTIHYWVILCQINQFSGNFISSCLRICINFNQCISSYKYLYISAKELSIYMQIV